MRKSVDLEWFWGKLESYLGKNQLKQTAQRRKIIEIFLDCKNHIDAEQLHLEVRNRGFNIGLATIYRTLNLLKEANLVEQRDFVEGRAVFESITPSSHHDHLICRDCDHIIEFENGEIEDLQKQVALNLGFALQGHRLDLYGKCLTKNCPRRKG